jgi:hypothetical protein
MIELRFFGPWMKCNANIVLLYFFKFSIMLGIILCCNRDIIPTWWVGKSVSQLTHFERTIYSHVMSDMSSIWTDVLITKLVVRPLFVKSSNEKLKWNMDVNVRTSWYDVCLYIYIYIYIYKWGIHLIRMSCC